MCTSKKTVAREIPGLNKILAGDESGWEDYYQHYLPIVTAQVARSGIGKTLKGGVHTKDVAHDVIAGLARNDGEALRNLKEPTDQGMTGYLRSAVVNHHRDLIGQKKRRRKQWGEQLPLAVAEERENLSEEDVVAGYLTPRVLRPDVAYELEETRQIIFENFKHLDSRYATILRMLVEGSSHKEIAEKLGVDVKSVGSMVKRARERMRKIVMERHPEHFCDLP